MEMVARIAALCIVAALLALILKRGTPELGLLLTVVAAVVVLLDLLGEMAEIVSFLDELAERSGAGRALFIPLYKTVAIALVVKLGGGLCKDAGESALGSLVETSGAICALLAALPMLRTALELLLEMMK